MFNLTNRLIWNTVPKIWRLHLIFLLAIVVIRVIFFIEDNISIIPKFRHSFNGKLKIFINKWKKFSHPTKPINVLRSSKDFLRMKHRFQKRRFWLQYPFFNISEKYLQFRKKEKHVIKMLLNFNFLNFTGVLNKKKLKPWKFKYNFLWES